MVKVFFFFASHSLVSLVIPLPLHSLFFLPSGLVSPSFPVSMWSPDFAAEIKESIDRRRVDRPGKQRGGDRS